MRVADYIIKFLESKGIRTAFTMSGGGSIFLCDALYQAKKTTICMLSPRTSGFICCGILFKMQP